MCKEMVKDWLFLKLILKRERNICIDSGRQLSAMRKELTAIVNALV